MRPATLILVSLAAFGYCYWNFNSTMNQWERVSAVAFSPDGKTLAAGTYDSKPFNKDFHWYVGALVHSVALFNAETGSGRVLIDESTGASGATPSALPGRFLAFSPDGETLAVGSWDGTVRLWDPNSRLLKQTLQAESPHVAAVEFSADGRILVAGYRGGVFTLWETAKYGEGKGLDTYATRAFFAISPTTNFLAVDRMGDGPDLWDVTLEKRVEAIPDHESRLSCLTFSPDGRLLAMGGEKSTIVWDLVDNKQRFEFEGSWISDVAFSPDGQILATAGEKDLQFWNTETGVLDSIRTPKRVRSIAFSPDGRLLATGRSGGTVSVWDVGSDKMIWSALVDWSWKPSVPVLACGILGLISFLIGGLRIWKGKRASSVPRSLEKNGASG